MECKKCGAYLPDDAEYCTECGEPVITDNIEYFDDEQEHEDNQDLKVPSLSSTREAELQAIKERRNQKRKREKRNKIILIVVIAAIAAGGVGYGIYSIRENWIGNETVIETPRPSATATAEPIASPSPETSPEASPLPEATPDENGVIPTSSVSENQNGGSGTQSGEGSSSGSGSSTSSSNGSSIRTVKPSGGSGSSSASRTSRPSGGSQSSSGSGSSSSSSGTNNVPKTTNKVAMGSTMVNQNIKGKEIAVDASTGRRLFVFTIGNDSFLANIDSGTTTEMVQGQYYTIDAAPSGEEYAGLPVYEITSIFKYTDYILPESDKRILSESEVAKLSKKQLALARNEIFARHGRAFSNSEYKAYFESKPWYKVDKNFNYDNESSNLSDIEKANLITIINCENKK